MFQTSSCQNPVCNHAWLERSLTFYVSKHKCLVYVFLYQDIQLWQTNTVLKRPIAKADTITFSGRKVRKEQVWNSRRIFMRRMRRPIFTYYLRTDFIEIFSSMSNYNNFSLNLKSKKSVVIILFQMATADNYDMHTITFKTTYIRSKNWIFHLRFNGDIIYNNGNKNTDVMCPMWATIVMLFLGPETPIPIKFLSSAP